MGATNTKATSEATQVEPAAVWVPIGQLTEWAENPRKNDKAVDKVARSIKRFGFGAPILARQENGEIIAGHTRFKAAQKLGLERVPVRYLNLDPAEAHLLAIADNRVGEEAQWDDEKLAALFATIKPEDRLDTGFDDREINQLQAIARGAVGGEADAGQTEQAEPVSKLGDLWVLGQHRLLCGDSTDPANVARLMDGELADMMWTDPPYGVSYVGKTKDALTIQNDKLVGDELETFLSKCFYAADGALKPGSALYVAHRDIRELQFLHAFAAAGWRHRQILIWVKNSLIPGHSDYHYRHEPILFGYKPCEGRRGRGGEGWFGTDNETTVFEVDRPKANDLHPTMKPVELVARMVNNSSPPDGTVFEPFGGSGTTLLACEQLGRSCRAIELDPKYCDVIIARWEKATGRKAVRSDGQQQQA